MAQILAEQSEALPELVSKDLIEIHLAARQVDVRPFEEAESSRVLDELVPQVVRVLEQALAAFAKLAEEGAPGLSEAEEAEAGASLEDLAHIARFELVEEQQRFERLVELREHCELVTSSTSLLGKLRKTSAALENSWSERLGLEPQLCQFDDLDQSLKLRRAYAKFRLAVSSGGTPGTPQDLRRHLKTVATAIACLGGRDAYWNLRFSDRQQLRGLQRRLLAWIADTQAGEEDGFHLWQDLESFVHLLDAINSRTELAEHDYQLILEAVAILFGDDGEGDDDLPGDWVVRLTALLGRDFEVDQLLFSLGPQKREDWRIPLERLMAQLSPPEPPAEQNEWRRGDTAEIAPTQFVPAELLSSFGVDRRAETRKDK